MSASPNAHVVQVYEFWFQRDKNSLPRTYIRMTLCDGTLGRYLVKLARNGVVMEPLELTEIMIHVLTGLYHCHMQGICNRNITMSTAMF